MTLLSRAAAVLAGLCLVLAPQLAPAPGAGPGLVSPAVAGPSQGEKVLRISAIPDQKPEKLNRLYPLVAGELGRQLGVKVKYVPVVDYAAAVSAFRTGDLDLVWFGGLTGVQARLQKPGAKVIAQRDIDVAFHSIFIANTKSGMRRRFMDVTSSLVVIAVTIAVFLFVGWTLTEGQHDPRVIHFWQTSRRMYTP